MDIVLVTPPEGDVLTLAAGKSHLRLESDDEDTDVQAAIDASVEYLDGPEGVTGRCLLPQTWKIYFDYAFPSWRIPLPLSPLISVDEISYIDSDGSTKIVDPSVYQVIDGDEAAVQPAYGKAWFAPRSQPRAVAITFTAGYDGGPPKRFITVIKLLLGHFFMNREATVGIDQRGTPMELPVGVNWLLPGLTARSRR